jgi:hypothetical protein
MFNSQVLEVSLGLVFVFLLVSLILTAVMESIEAISKSRAVDLEKALSELLEDRDGTGLRKRLYDHPLIAALYPGDYVATRFDGDGNRIDGGSKRSPSYIPREQFALALLDLARSGQVQGPVYEALETMRQSVGGDLERLRKEVGGWYDGAMDRASGWFRRRKQVLLFWFGLAVAIALNVNAVTIGQELAVNAALRQAVARLAEESVPTLATVVPDGGAEAELPALDAAAAAQVRVLQAQVRALELPIGWDEAAVQRIRDALTGANLATGGAFLLVLVAGYLMTAFAATLGAPFWFDVLNKIMVVRSTVKPTEKSKDEGSEDRRAPAAEPETQATPPVVVAPRDWEKRGGAPLPDRGVHVEHVYG